MSKHEVGFAHTNEIACKKKLDCAGDGSQPIRMDSRGLAPIPGNHERLYRDCMKAYTGKTARLYQENILV